MTLVVRLLKTVVLWLLKPSRLPLLGESVVRFRVWPNDLDNNFHMNNGRYLTLMDLGRLDQLLRSGAIRHVVRQRWYPVLAGATIRFRRPLSLFQRFEIRTRIVSWDTKWLYLEQRILRGGDLVLHAYVKGIFLGRSGGSVPITGLLELLGERAPPPPMPDGLVAWLDAEQKAIREARSETNRS